MKVSACFGCPLGEGQIVVGDGDPQADVMVVSAFPGTEEIKEKKPFAGTNGQIVRGVFAGLAGDSVWFTHLVKRNPGTPRLSIAKAGKCTFHLQGEIRSVRPKVVVAMGSQVLRYLAPAKGLRLSVVHGLLIPVNLFGHDCLLLGVHDIGYVMRSGGLSGKKGTVWMDDIEEIVPHVEG